VSEWARFSVLTPICLSRSEAQKTCIVQITAWLVQIDETPVLHWPDAPLGVLKTSWSGGAGDRGSERIHDLPGRSGPFAIAAPRRSRWPHFFPRRESGVKPVQIGRQSGVNGALRVATLAPQAGAEVGGDVPGAPLNRESVERRAGRARHSPDSRLKGMDRVGKHTYQISRIADDLNFKTL
jgi:hypothetical protein